MIYERNSWSVGHFIQNGAPMVVRARTALPNRADREAYGHLIVIKWPYAPGTNGMPDTIARSGMQELESTLESAVETKEIGVQALSLTGNGVREWRYYTNDPKKFMEALNHGLIGKNAFPIDLQLLQDPKWTALAEFVGDST